MENQIFKKGKTVQISLNFLWEYVVSAIDKNNYGKQIKAVNFIAINKMMKKKTKLNLNVRKTVELLYKIQQELIKISTLD